MREAGGKREAGEEGEKPGAFTGRRLPDPDPDPDPGLAVAWVGREKVREI
jgi:hypothetical protein